MEKTPPPVSNIKSIWAHKDPFAKPPTKMQNDAVKDAADKKTKDAAQAVTDAAQESADAEANLVELKARGKVPTTIKVVDFTGGAEGNLLKMTISVRNFGDALARDVKVKCIGNPRLSLISSPMATIGDITPRGKSIAQFVYGMPENYYEEYANFAVSAEAENAKPYSQLFTLKTGRRIMTATEVMEKMNAENRKSREGKDKH
ncbi:MAG: hypothetical protein A2008_00335 [Candidatus Wallbacteria bacterium GWC2_49_35]|uniref:CARDB domain-containing protein n=1 Tax=Candidatus Wallbacteria bacterium GWC2_49_35 TaxID=1817813 RepID=A0A1F7WFZ0_9BACT|nr:MAG: hypothetical protein A2008_00335 [Candidatus Wallbacteria bacterium GWC2_49_35]HBC74653.1 hypothetical protein [Candidatus Wallbacteria bacterium]